MRKLLLGVGVALWMCLSPVNAQPRVINNPEGGAMALCEYPGATEEQAVVASLKALYQSFGVKPRPGQLLRQLNSHTLTLFFEVPPSKADGQPRSGLILVEPSPGGQRTAVLVDYPQRFGHTGKQMLQALYGGGQVASAQLIPTNFLDGSASMSLLPGWRVVQSNMGQGTIQGPNGERITACILFYFADPGADSGGYMIGSRDNLVGSWQRNLALRCQQNGIPVPTMEITNANQSATGADVDGSIDFGDGQGPRVLKARLNLTELGYGIWTLCVTSISIPEALAAQEMPVALAMVRSYRENAQVITAGAQRANAEKNAWFEAQQAGYRAQQAGNDSYNAGYWARQDSNARQSQAFSNYLLDKTVVSDNQGGHGTFSNDAVNALLQAYPSQFQVVPTAGYVNHIDY